MRKHDSWFKCWCLSFLWLFLPKPSRHYKHSSFSMLLKTVFSDRVDIINLSKYVRFIIRLKYSYKICAEKLRVLNVGTPENYIGTPRLVVRANSKMLLVCCELNAGKFTLENSNTNYLNPCVNPTIKQQCADHKRINKQGIIRIINCYAI